MSDGALFVFCVALIKLFPLINLLVVHAACLNMISQVWVHRSRELRSSLIISCAPQFPCRLPLGQTLNVLGRFCGIFLLTDVIVLYP